MTRACRSLLPSQNSLDDESKKSSNREVTRVLLRALGCDCDARKPGFDRLLDLFVELPRVLAGGFDRLADDHPDRAGLFQETAPRPECAGIVRQRHHALAGCDRKHGATEPELARLARNHPGSFREDDDPQAVLEPRLALFDHLV